MQNSCKPTATFVDIFGGSGLLSHTVKYTLPQAKVVYNDFDNFIQRLYSVAKTNKLLAKLREELGDYPRGQRIDGEYRERVFSILKQADASGFVDWISISSSLLFSMNYELPYEAFTKQTLYNSVLKLDFSTDGNLEGVDIVSADYQVIYERYKNVDDVVFLVDPPYLSTDTSTYNSADYWKLKDYLDVLQVLTDTKYFYFTSNKSQVVELYEWISSVSDVANPFYNAQCTEIPSFIGG